MGDIMYLVYRHLGVFMGSQTLGSARWWHQTKTSDGISSGRGGGSLVSHHLPVKDKYGKLMNTQPEGHQLISDFPPHLPPCCSFTITALGYFQYHCFGGTKGLSFTSVLWSILGFPSHAASSGKPHPNSHSSLFPISHQESSLKSKQLTSDG